MISPGSECKTKTPNEFVVDGNVCRIKLFSGREALIDTENLSKVIDFKWTDEGRYAINVSSKIYLHHFVFGVDKNEVQLDHKNRNGLDNRKFNLRPCSTAQNAWNSCRPITNKSGRKGVCWCNIRKKWRATIAFNRNQKHLGYFDNFLEAVRIRRKGEVKYHKEFVAEEGL